MFTDGCDNGVHMIRHHDRFAELVDLLDEARRSNPGLERYFNAEQWHEPVFVKNLENVQGDERDTIIFFVAVGPDAAGKVNGTISSLNRQGGHRRLNVAITRARIEMLIYATLRPEQIDIPKVTAAESSILSISLNTRFEAPKTPLTGNDQKKRLN